MTTPTLSIPGEGAAAVQSVDPEMSPVASLEIRTLAGRQRVILRGPWTLKGLRHNLPALRTRLDALARNPSHLWDLRAIEALDSIGTLILWQAWGGRLPNHLRSRRGHLTLLQQWSTYRPLPRSRRMPLLKHLTLTAGLRLLATLSHLQSAATLLGRLVLDSLPLVRRPARIPWRDISGTIYEVGARAMLLTALVGALVGMVVSNLSSLELRALGAQILVVKIVGLGVTRELGPMLTTILVAARSGSAMTAQLGVMRVTQELDALAAMGIPHTVRLVLPKAIALLVAVPLLVVWTDAAAIFGGMAAAKALLGMSYGQFLAALPHAVPVMDFWIGIGKASVFGMMLAMTAAHFGLRIKANAVSLSKETTNSVVTMITLVIVFDALFAMLLSGAGLQ